MGGGSRYTALRDRAHPLFVVWCCLIVYDTDVCYKERHSVSFLQYNRHTSF